MVIRVKGLQSPPGKTRIIQPQWRSFADSKKYTRRIKQNKNNPKRKEEEGNKIIGELGITSKVK